MRFLRVLHLYLGCLFAPALIFFAVTGSWQLFNYHKTTKDGSYVPPDVISILSDIHTEAHIPPTPPRSPTPLRYFMLLAATGLVTTTLLGVVMAFRFSRRPLVATVCLLLGLALPGFLLWLYR